ncbi:MAG: glycosyltransferase family 39 protein, partial [Chitinispirillaceae bacterium]|nr:glycosyltransferase family 39 protein [Chitinispirillaceae bacterium]
MVHLLKENIRNAVRDHPVIILSGIIGFYLLGIVIATGFLQCPSWGVDEPHHIETVRLFVSSLSYHTIKTYAELHPPLVYILYALAGIVCGDHIWVYRLLTLVFTAITINALFFIMRFLSESNGRALSGVIVFLMNPYVMGLSVFVYSDMPGLMFLSLAVLAALHRRSWLFCVAAACSLLCRQYNVFVPLAVSFWATALWVQSRKRDILRLPCAALLSLIPVVICFFYWGGLAPHNGIAVRNPWGSSHVFHPAYIPAYLIFLPVYVAPLILYFWRHIFSLKRLVIASLIGFVYPLFPVTVRPAIKEDTGMQTVGFFHKAIKEITGGNTWIEHAVFYCLFCLSLCLIFRLAATTAAAQRNGGQRPENLLFGAVMSLCFFAVMVFSLDVWEKYLVPFLPFFIAWILSCAPDKKA